VEGKLPVEVPLGAGDLGPVQPAGDADLIPRAPKRSAASTALRIARRKAIRFSSWRATDSETSWASSSGLRISWMLMKTSLPVRFLDLLLQLVHLLPLAPDDDPRARGVDGDFSLLARVDLDPADAGVAEALLQVLLESESSCRRFAYSFSAYQRLARS